MRVYTKKTLKDINRYKKFFKSLDSCVVGRSGLIGQLMLAVLVGEHVLLEGSAGVGKSYLAHLFLDNVTGIDVFKVQCTKKMSEDYIVGALDMVKFREEGTLIHRTEGTLVDCDYAFIDEVFDLSSGALRGLLEILNERTFTRGVQHEKSSLQTCIAATNFNKDDEDELSAVLDRFMFRSEVLGLSTSAQKLKMLRSKGSMETIDVSTIDNLKRLVSKVTIPSKVLELYVSVCAEIPNVSDRSLVKGLKVLKASALISGRSYCMKSDITQIGRCFSILGNKESELAFAKAMKVYASDVGSKTSAPVVYLIYNRLRKLYGMFKDIQEYKEGDIAEIVSEVVTIKAAITVEICEDVSIRARMLDTCNIILTSKEI